MNSGAFFDDNEHWLERNLEQGRTKGQLDFNGAPLGFARTLTAALEGAMLLARSYQDPERFADTARHMLDQMRAPVGAAARLNVTATSRQRR